MAQYQNPFLRGLYGDQQAQQATLASQLQQASGAIGLQGALAQQFEAARKAGQEREFRSEVTALGQNPDQAALTGVASRFARPSDVLKTKQSSLDRKAALEAMATQ